MPAVVVLVVPETLVAPADVVPQVQVAPDSVTLIVVIPVFTVSPDPGSRVGVAVGVAALI